MPTFSHEPWAPCACRCRPLWGKATRSESDVSLQLRVARKRNEAVLGLGAQGLGTPLIRSCCAQERPHCRPFRPPACIADLVSKSKLNRRTVKRMFEKTNLIWMESGNQRQQPELLRRPSVCYALRVSSHVTDKRSLFVLVCDYRCPAAPERNHR